MQPVLGLQYLIEDSYESLKFLNYFYNLRHKFFFVTALGHFLPLSHSSVFDTYRSNFDEFT
jgi:hypothetical protein